MTSSPLRIALDRIIDELTPEAVAFLAALVAAPSILGREEGAQDLVAAALAATGFGIERLAVPDTIAHDRLAGVPALPYEGRHDVVGTRDGRGDGPHLLLNSHIDVVPADSPELWSSPPFEPVVRDGWMIGRGAGDMKCGFAATILAIRALDAACPGWQHGRLTFLSAIEEECTGNGTLAAIRAGIVADAVLLPEPTDLELLLGGIGILWFEVTIEGRSAHAHAANRAVNPVDVALRLIAGLRAWESELNHDQGDLLLSDAEHPYNLNIGTVRAGDWQSSVPTTATIGFRLGYPRSWSAVDAEDRVRATVATIGAADPWLATTMPDVRLNGFRAEGYALDPDAPLALAVARAHADAHGDAPPALVMASTTDARHYLNECGIPAICYGPRTRNIHGVDEAVEIASIPAAARTLARFMLDYLGSDAG